MPPTEPRCCTARCPSIPREISIDLTWDTLGIRATGSHTVVLDDVFVPDAAVALSRPADQWHPVWNTVCAAAMPLIMSAYLGVADTAVDAGAIGGHRTQRASRLPVGGRDDERRTTANDLVTAMFVDADNLQFDNTDEIASRTLSRRTVASDALIDTVRLAIEATGGVGYTAAPTSSGSIATCTDVSSIRCRTPSRPRLTGRVALGLSPVG